MKSVKKLLLPFLLTVVSQGFADSVESINTNSAEAMAKKLANPIAALISLPMQLNYDRGFQNGTANKWTLNVQPVYQ